MSDEVLAVLTVEISAEKVATFLDTNPGSLTYKEMAVQLRVAAEHLDRLDPEKDYKREKSIVHVAVDPDGMPL